MQSLRNIFGDLLKFWCNIHFGGIPSNANECFLNDLTHGKQYIEIKNTKCGFQNKTCDVPQGSILVSFADYTSLNFSDSKSNHLFNHVNSNVTDWFDWFCANRLSLNPTKTKYIVCRSYTKKTVWLLQKRWFHKWNST